MPLKNNNFCSMFFDAFFLGVVLLASITMSGCGSEPSYYSVTPFTPTTQSGPGGDTGTPGTRWAVKFDAGWLKQTPATRAYPVDLYIVLDVTGSMGVNVNEIAQRIAEYASEIQTASMMRFGVPGEVRFGAVAFRDGIASTQRLTTDVAVFTSYLLALRAEGGGDANEAGLEAIRLAVKNLDEDDPTPGSIKAMFYFTDNPAHNGGDFNIPPPGQVRDCSLDQTLDAFKARSIASFGPLNFFYSVPAGGVPCKKNAAGEKFLTTKEQMEALIAGYAFPNANNGLAFPITKSILDDLQEKLILLPAPDVDVCLAKQADFYKTSGWVGKWSSAGMPMSDIAAMYTSKTPLVMELDQDVSDPSSYQEVIYSCFDVNDVAAGNFSRGVDEPPKRQSIQMK